jgi:hypothetical protein
MSKAKVLAVGSLGAGVGYLLVATGAMSLDVNIGRRLRPLGPIERVIEAPPELVFDVIADPYLNKTPHAMESKLRVLERGADMALAEHYTAIGAGLTATTLETVRFERPSRIHFRLLRGPVPYVVETFELNACAAGTDFRYSGEMGADLWCLGSWWATVVAARWEETVGRSLVQITREAERRAVRSANR